MKSWKKRLYMITPPYITSLTPWRFLHAFWPIVPFLISTIVLKLIEATLSTDSSHLFQPHLLVMPSFILDDFVTDLLQWDLSLWSIKPVSLLYLCPLKGGRECPMSSPCLESQGCHLIPLYYLLSCFSAWSCYSFCLFFFFLLSGPFAWTFSETSSIFFTSRSKLVGSKYSMLPYGTGICCYAFIPLFFYFFFIASVHSFLHLFKENWYR